jgi:hypothetical protein
MVVQLPFHFRTQRGHSNTRLVRYLDVYCSFRNSETDKPNQAIKPCPQVFYVNFNILQHLLHRTEKLDDLNATLFSFTGKARGNRPILKSVWASKRSTFSSPSSKKIRQAVPDAWAPSAQSGSSRKCNPPSQICQSLSAETGSEVEYHIPSAG